MCMYIGDDDDTVWEKKYAAVLELYYKLKSVEIVLLFL